MKNNEDITIVMYHYVRDLKHSRFPQIKGLDLESFKEQILYFKKKYNFIRIEDVMAHYWDSMPLPSNPILLTFDDAYIDHYENVFPFLYNNGIQGCFYTPVKAIMNHSVLDVNKIHFILASIPAEDVSHLLNEIKFQLDRFRSEYQLKSYEYYFEKLAIANRFDTKEVIFVKRLLQVELEETLRKRIVDDIFGKVVGLDEEIFSRELYMSIDQLKCMVNSGMHIGCHGYDHCWLGCLSKEKQELEIQRSVDFLKEIGVNCSQWSMCYPYGSYNLDTIDLLRKHNCKLGLCTEVGKAKINDASSDTIYKLPRLDTNDFPVCQNANTDNWINK